MSFGLPKAVVNRQTQGPRFGTACKELHITEQSNRARARIQQLALDFSSAALLSGLFVVAALRLWPKLPSQALRPPSAFLIATLLPLASLVLLSMIERLFAPAGPRRSLKSWFLHLQINIFWVFVAGFTFTHALITTTAVSKHLGLTLGLIDLRFAEGKGVLLLLGSIWLSAIAGDFVSYWYHRLMHAIPFLWHVHKLHHMDRELDVLTLARESWLDAVFGAVLVAVPISILFKVDNSDPWELGLVGGSIATVFRTLLTLGHMNVKLQVSKLRLLYCSPQVHRIHHSRLPQHLNKNFAVVFPLWDVLFGTYYAPARDEFPPTGVSDLKDIGSLWEAETLAVREWWKMLRAWRQAPRNARSLRRVA